MGERVVVDVSGLAPGQMRPFTANGRRLLVCNAEGRFYALEDRCPHAFVALSAGRLRGCVLECPRHGGSLDVRDGSPKAPPIRRPAASFSVHPVEGGLEIDLGA